MRTRVRRGGGFTLVELLVVLTIIAMLAALTTTVAFNAIQSAKKGRIKTEVQNLAQAIEAFKVEYGSYPPLLNDRVAVTRFANRNFQDRASGELPPAGDPAQSLVYWLSGFSDDPLRPFTGANRKSRFDFEPTRLKPDGDAMPRYYPPGKERPYVYFDSRSYTSGDATYEGLKPYTTGVDGDTNKPMPKANSFQIISAGLDDEYGEGGVWPTNPDDPDFDNITNLNDKSTLGDSVP